MSSIVEVIAAIAFFAMISVYLDRKSWDGKYQKMKKELTPNALPKTRVVWIWCVCHADDSLGLLFN